MSDYNTGSGSLYVGETDAGDEYEEHDEDIEHIENTKEASNNREGNQNNEGDEEDEDDEVDDEDDDNDDDEDIEDIEDIEDEGANRDSEDDENDEDGNGGIGYKKNSMSKALKLCFKYGRYVKSSKGRKRDGLNAVIMGITFNKWDSSNPFVFLTSAAARRFTTNLCRTHNTTLYELFGVGKNSPHPAKPAYGPTSITDCPLHRILRLQEYEQGAWNGPNMPKVIDVAKNCYPLLPTDCAADWDNVQGQEARRSIWYRQAMDARDRMVAVVCQAFLQADKELVLAHPIRTSFPGRGSALRSDAGSQEKFTANGTVCIRLLWRDNTEKALPIYLSPVGGRDNIDAVGTKGTFMRVIEWDHHDAELQAKFEGSPVLLLQDVFFLFHVARRRSVRQPQLSTIPKQYSNVWYLKHRLKKGDRMSSTSGEIHTIRGKLVHHRLGHTSPVASEYHIFSSVAITLSYLKEYAYDFSTHTTFTVAFQPLFLDDYEVKVPTSTGPTPQFKFVNLKLSCNLFPGCIEEATVEHQEYIVRTYHYTQMKYCDVTATSRQVSRMNGITPKFAWSSIKPKHIEYVRRSLQLLEHHRSKGTLYVLDFEFWTTNNDYAPIGIQGCILNAVDGKIASFNQGFPFTRKRMRELVDNAMNTKQHLVKIHEGVANKVWGMADNGPSTGKSAADIYSMLETIGATRQDILLVCWAHTKAHIQCFRRLFCKTDDLMIQESDLPPFNGAELSLTCLLHCCTNLIAFRLQVVTNAMFPNSNSNVKWHSTETDTFALYDILKKTMNELKVLEENDG